MVGMKFYGNEILNIELFYKNTKNLRVYDFIKSIKKDLLYNLSKNCAFIYEISLEYKIKGFSYANGFYYNNEFGIDGVSVDDYIAVEVVDYANDQHNLDLQLIYDDDDYPYELEYFVNDVDIDYFEFTIHTHKYKILHKEKFDEEIQEELLYESNRRIHKRNFYNDLWEDLLPIAWDPTRILNWCIDVEELEELKERWGIDW